jgi:NADP-dependent 3-hydroxy acid dehydrogenase YdfG
MAPESTPARHSEHFDNEVAWLAGAGGAALLGAAGSRRFAPDGFVAALTGRNSDRVRTTADGINRSGGAAIFDARDADSERLRAAASQVAEVAGVDGLSNPHAIAENLLAPLPAALRCLES